MRPCDGGSARRPGPDELIPLLDRQQLGALRLIAQHQGRLPASRLPRLLVASLLAARAIQAGVRGGEVRLTHLGLLALLQAEASANRQRQVAERALPWCGAQHARPALAMTARPSPSPSP